MRVHHPRDHEEARAVDPFGTLGRTADDASVGDGKVGAAELARADVDETVFEQEAQIPAAGEGAGVAGIAPASASLAMSTIAPSGTFVSSAGLLKASARLSRKTATSAT